MPYFGLDTIRKLVRSRVIGRYARYVTYKPFDVLVFRDGPYAVAVDSKGKIIDKNTDHASVIQEAIDRLKDTGGKIVIKAGEYNITKSIEISNEHGLIIEGEGAAGFGRVDATRLVVDASLQHGIRITDSWGIVIRNLGLRTTSAENTTVGILVEYGTGASHCIVFERLHLYWFGIGIKMKWIGGTKYAARISDIYISVMRTTKAFLASMGGRYGSKEHKGCW